jgi:archaellum biogenesis ATPase FlaH
MVFAELKRLNLHESAGGLTYLSALDEGLPEIANLGGYIRIIRDKAALRRLAMFGNSFRDRCLLETESPAELRESAVQFLRELADGELQPSRVKRVEDIPILESLAAAEVEWDVHGVIPRASVVMITAEPGAGKSTIASAFGYAVSRGTEFLGRKTSKRPVLMLDAENPAAFVSERFQRLGIATHEGFRVWGQWVGEGPPAGGAIIEQWITRSEPKPLLIVDSFIRFHPGLENDASDTQKYMGMYRRLAALGATIAILHHTGKAETAQDYRGSSDILASVDVAYKLTNLGDGSQLSLLELRAFKQRIAVAPRLLFRYQNGKFVSDEREALKTVTERLVELLQANPGITTAEFEKLAAAQSLGRNRARDFLRKGSGAGTVRIEHGSSNCREHFWKGDSKGETWFE